MTSNQLWIHTRSGTWGSDVEDLRIVNVEDVMTTSETPDDEFVYEALDAMTDSEIGEFGQRYGKPVDHGFTPEADRVIDTVNAEIGVNLDASDVHSVRDIAADVVERLIRDYHLTGFNRDQEIYDLGGSL